MARNKTWHNANANRQLGRSAAGKPSRIYDGRGKARAREAWNRRRGLARARGRLQRLLIAEFGLKPRHRLRGKQPRHSLDPDSTMVLAKRMEPSAGKPEVAAVPCSGRVAQIAIGWPSDVAVAASPCAPEIASPTPLSEGEPLDDGMLQLLGEHIGLCANLEQKRLCQQTFRFLARVAGARV